MTYRRSDEGEDDLVWIPAPQDEASPYFGFHEGDLALFVRCGACGCTTRAHATLYVFVACTRCGAELPIAWNVGIA